MKRARVHTVLRSLVLAALAGLLLAWVLGGAGRADGPVPGGAEAPSDLDPAALAADEAGGLLYVAEAAAGQIAVVGLADGKVARSIPAPGWPLDLALLPGGKKLCVADGRSAGRVLVLDVVSGKLDGAVPVGHTPTALALGADGRTLFVCNRFTDDVSVVDLAAGKETARIHVLRQPVAAALTGDGKTLVVANHLPAGRADTGDVAACVSLVDTDSRKVRSHVRLVNGSTGLRGVCVSPDGKYAYTTHILARYLVPTSQVDRGWMNTNAVSIIDVAAGKLLACVLVDDMDRGAANPWGIACTPDGKRLLVTHAGTHELSVIDREALHRKIQSVHAQHNALAKSKKPPLRTPTPIENDLAFLVGLRRRIALPGNGPRAVAVAGGAAYVAMHFSDGVAAVDLDADARPSVREIALGPKRAPSVVRRGEMLFNDGTACFQGWQSCATCHPDARSDGLNWDLLNDGLGNLRQSKSLLGSHRTPPVMITGVRPKAETAVRAGMKFIQFVMRPEEDSVAVDEYLKSLKPVPSPHRLDGKPSAAAERGAKVFDKAGCARCHPAPLFTDLKKYEVGIGHKHEGPLAFDTPTLIEIWRTAPYLMDGRAATMMDVLTKHNQGDKHGKTSDLSRQELADLAAYVLSQ